MNHLSDMNLRAVLLVLVVRAGGAVEIANEELYDAMLPEGGDDGRRLTLTETPGGVLISVRPSRRDQAGSN